MKKLILISIIFISAFLSPAVWARENLTIKTPDGLKDLFIFDIAANAGETFSIGASDWTLAPEQISAIKIAGQYWASLLGNFQKNTQPVSLSFGTYNLMNDDSTKIMGEYGFGMTALAVAVTSNEFRDFDQYTYDGRQHKAYSTIRMGFVSAPNIDYAGGMKILPDNGNSAQMAGIILHEIGHSFGLSANIMVGMGGGTFVEYASGSAELSIYDKRLVDSFGNHGAVNMDIVSNAAAQSGKFTIIPSGDARLDDQSIGGYAFFQGANVDSVIVGIGFGAPYLSFNNPEQIEGIPILAYENGNLDMSHIELRNSMMSHQKYRNWNIYMEAELALLQDIGLVIDRRNFYGLSVYSDNDNLIIWDNDLIFYARKLNDSQVWEYDIGKYNETPWTIAFHIYGSTNNVDISSGDIALTKGYSSVGIRIDGWNNRLNIENGAIFRADGEDGIGLLVSYGKNQKINLDGIISANGKDGIGARFDFGDNIMGNNKEYRGSYIRGKTDIYGNWDIDMPLLYELNGALISAFTISGTLEGQKAAIYISKNAFVDRIFILNGAKISGDIISDWNPNADFVQNISGVDKNKLKTDLFLGVSIDAVNNILPDTNFAFIYDGDIKAQKALNVLLFNGNFIYGATMSGLSNFYAGGLSSFTVNTKNKSSISAEKIVFAPLSNLVVNFDEDFVYGSQIVFNLFSQDISFNQDNVKFVSRETVSAGFYDNLKPEIRLNQNSAGVAFEMLVIPTADTVLSKERAAISAIGAPLLLSIADKGADAVFEREKTHNFGFWIKPQYDYTWSGGESDYSINNPSLTFGLDKSFENYFFGAALHFANPTYKSNAADIDENTVSAFIYGGLNLPSQIDLTLLAGIGSNKYSQNRFVKGLQNDADFNGQSYDLGFKLSRQFPLNPTMSFSPFISYEYLSLNTDGFEESGSAFALKFGSSQLETNRFKIGTAFQNILSDKIKINAKIFYMGLFGDISAKNDIAFIENKNISIISESEEAGAHYFGGGANIQYKFSDIITFNLGANFDIGGKNGNAGIYGSMALHW